MAAGSGAAGLTQLSQALPWVPGAGRSYGEVAGALHGACVQMRLCKSNEELMMSVGSEAVINLLGTIGTCKELQS